MRLLNLFLQNFRNYSKHKFDFSPKTTLIIGPNTCGKSNLIEAVFFLSKGESFRVDRDEQLVKFGENLARIKGRLGDKELEAVIAQGGVSGHLRPFKKYLVNGVSRRRVDFVGNFFAVLFAPNDLDIIIGSPSKRRDFIDHILTEVDRDYRLTLGFYEKGLRIRNALLHKIRETGKRSEKEFLYWDNLLISQGQKITEKRESFIRYLEQSKKEILDFKIFYDKSIISKDRLLQYKDAEVGAGVTMVGPHRDDFILNLKANPSAGGEPHDIKFFGSRGQQRLAALQLKILELIYVTKTTGEQPVLLLDDILSELDEEHIDLVLSMLGGQQTILTTTHKEFIPKKISNKAVLIDVDK